MYCTKCGKENPEGTLYCTECGTPLTEETAEAAVEHVEEAVKEEIPETVYQQSVEEFEAQPRENKFAETLKAGAGAVGGFLAKVFKGVDFKYLPNIMSLVGSCAVFLGTLLPFITSRISSNYFSGGETQITHYNLFALGREFQFSILNIIGILLIVGSIGSFVLLVMAARNRKFLAYNKLCNLVCFELLWMLVMIPVMLSKASVSLGTFGSYKVGAGAGFWFLFIGSVILAGSSYLRKNDRV